MSESTATETESASAPSDMVPATEPAASAPPGAQTHPSSTGTDDQQPDGRRRKNRNRRLLRAVGRWTAAVVVFGVLGTGVGYGISEQERGDLPGLATETDGRWNYPDLELPRLPAGAPRPFAESNAAEIHHVDIRDLLLSPPDGAAGSEGLPWIDGEWVTSESFAELYAEEDRADIEQRLVDDAVRHIAARGWKMPDGTRTSVYLLQFNSTMYPYLFYTEEIAPGITPSVAVAGSREAEVDESWPSEAEVPNVDRYAFDEAKPRGEEHVRQAYLIAGDTLAVIVQARKGTAHAVPFQQTVILQSQLLG